ncbi:MAG TPA: LptA/OstA family protein [Microvirga sp.]|jgi:lipopolysaccharide export system protein LptA
MTKTLSMAAALLLAAWPAAAQTGGAAKDGKPAAFGALGSNKEPIKIDADKLDVFDRESRAVFEGNVVAVQGDSTIKCTTLTVFYEQNRQGAATAGATTGATGAAPRPTPAAASGAGPTGDNQIRKIDCKGPVTIVSKTQVATGDNATFDRVANKVFLIGNVALSDGPNVTRGERIVYDLNSGVANVETKPGGRVKALFVPGSNPEGAGGADAAKPKPGARPGAPATN